MNAHKTLLTLVTLLGCLMLSQGQTLRETQDSKAPAPQAQKAAEAQPAKADAEPAPAASEGVETARFKVRYPRYRIQTGDALDLTFTLSPEFNQTVSVQPDGYISLKDAGDVHIEGMTTEEASRAIVKAYAKILRDPVVSLLLKDFEKPFFMVSGELKNPGKYELRGHTTVVQGIAIAGGFTESAKHSDVLLFRRISPDEVEVRKVNVKQMIAQKDLSEDLYLKPGDVLWVPQSTFSKLRNMILPRGIAGSFRIP